LRPEPSTGNAIESDIPALAGWVRSEFQSLGRRAPGGSLAVLAGFGVLALVWDPAVAGLGLLATAASVTGFARPYLLGPLVALLLPAGEAIHVLDAQVVPIEAVVGGGAVGYLCRVATRREVVRMRAVDWVFVALVACIALSTLGPVDNSDRLRELLFWGALGVVFHAVAAHVHDRHARSLLLMALAASILVEASWALFEYIDRWSERSARLGGAIVFPLPEGTLGHPNALGQFFVLSVLAVVALALAERGAVRWLGFVAAGAGSLGLIVTFSRASWIAFAVGASVYLLERKTRVPVLVAGGIAALGAAALAVLGAGAIGARISSLFSGRLDELSDFRLELARRAADITADHPLTGSGHFEEIGIYAGRPDQATHPHNLLLGLAVFFGIPAALAFSGLVVLALKSAWKGSGRGGADTQRLMAVGFLALLVALLVNGLFEYPFWNASLTALIVLSLAVAVTLDRAPAESGSSAGT